MRPAFEDMENAVGKKAAAHGQNVAVRHIMLMASEQAHWLHQMQVIPSAPHRHVQEAALFLDLLAAAYPAAVVGRGMPYGSSEARATSSLWEHAPPCVADLRSSGRGDL